VFCRFSRHRQSAESAKSNFHPTFSQHLNYGFGMGKLRSAPGMRERSPDVCELIVEAGREVVTGKRRQVSRVFHGNLRDAKKARAELLVEASKGRHSGSRATVDDLFADWTVELHRKGRSPNTIRGYERVYRHDIQPTLGTMPVTKVANQDVDRPLRRRLSARSAYQIQACLSSMFAQACRWGWRDSNPAQWAGPPPVPNTAPVAPTLQEVRTLTTRPNAADDRRWRGRSSSPQRPGFAAPSCTRFAGGATSTPNAACFASQRRSRRSLGNRLVRSPRRTVACGCLAIDEMTSAILRSQLEGIENRAALVGIDTVDDPYVFTDSVDGSEPWKPDGVSQYFARMRKRVGLDHAQFHQLRQFMETYGQEMGYSLTQVAMRAGHDPSIAAKHYRGLVHGTDRALASAVASLIAPTANL
jgi:hypothetical protein